MYGTYLLSCQSLVMGARYSVTLAVILRRTRNCSRFVQRLNAHDSAAIPSLIHPLFCSPQVSIFAYSDVVCRRVSDVVPKQVHYFLVDSLCDGLVRSMLQKATRADLEVWFAEGTKTLSRRKEITHKLSQFKQGVEVLEIARIVK